MVSSDWLPGQAAQEFYVLLFEGPAVLQVAFLDCLQRFMVYCDEVTGFFTRPAQVAQDLQAFSYRLHVLVLLI